MAVAKDQIRQIIAQNNLNSVADVYALLKDSFKDILQELMEAGLDASLGWDIRKIRKGMSRQIIKEMDIPKRISGVSTGDPRSMSPETAMGSLSPD